MAPRPKLAFGAGTLYSLETIDRSKTFLEACESLGIKELDTARAYGDSEATLGQLDAGKKFIIQTKVPAMPGCQTHDALIACQQKSFEELKVDSVDIYYLHGPDQTTPIEETLGAINELYTQGLFKRFGISNMTVEQTEAIYNHCKEKGYVLPTVFQGNYNPVSRHIEADLFPCLRRLGIAFYVYSAIAGGFLAKTVEQIKAGGEGRWDPTSFIGGMYHKLYNRPKVLEGLKEWEAIAKDAGIPPAELAYRYMAYHSFLREDLGDAIIVGATKPEQLVQTVEGLNKGPLPTDIAERVNKVWDVVKDEAPVNNIEGF